MVHPHLLYCLPVYCYTSIKNINTLFKKQKQCLRVINKAKYNAHTEPLFYGSDILPFRDLIKQQKLLLMHPLAHGYSSVNFAHFCRNTEINHHVYPLRNSTDFHVVRAQCNKVFNLPLADLSRTWNDLDETLKNTPSRNVFKSNVKNQLLENYNNFRCNKAICVSCMEI